VFTQGWIFIFIVNFFLVGSEPVLEDFLGLDIEVKPRDFIELVTDCAEIMEVGVGELVKDGEEGIFGFDIFVLVDVFAFRSGVWIDEKLESLEGAVMGEIGLGISEVLNEFYGLNATEEGETEDRDAEFAANHTQAGVSAESIPSLEVKSAVHLVSLHFPLGEHSGELITLEEDTGRVGL
jgi:hypothetical protein